MRKPDLLVPLLVCGLFLSACNGPIEEFQRVNNSLEDSLTASKDMLEQKYAYLQQMACAEGRLLSDSVNVLYERASERLFALDEALTGPAVSEEKAQGPFEEGGLASEALTYSQQLYALMIAICPEDSARAGIAAYGEAFTGLTDVQAWQVRDFQQAPPPVVTSNVERWVADMGRSKRLCTSALLAPCR
ncbi:MAG: hypothetical protein IPJ76_15255 [Flavobacteriales bacterium]|nr:MAG: hypothetical protein IPJ76_15255 [Flavobacteriales bacterium]